MNDKENPTEERNQMGKPKGIVIALIVNMQSIGLTKTAEKLNDILDQEL